MIPKYWHRCYLLVFGLISFASQFGITAGISCQQQSAEEWLLYGMKVGENDWVPNLPEEWTNASTGNKCQLEGVGCENGSVVSLILRGRGLSGIAPEELYCFPNLKELRLDDNPQLGYVAFGSISILSISNTNCSLNFLPAPVTLNYINARHSAFSDLSLLGGSFAHLLTLDVSDNNIVIPGELPKDLVNWFANNANYSEVPPCNGNNLEYVEISGNPLRTADFKDQPLVFLNMSNSIGSPNLTVGNSSQLTTAILSNNSFYGLSQINGVLNATHLTVLDLSHNPIKTIDSDAFTELAQLQYLNLSYCNLFEFPDAVLKLRNSLTHLSLRGNNFTEMPDAFSYFASLTMLDLTGNPLRSLPPSLGNITTMNALNLNQTALTILDEEVLSSPYIRELYLSELSAPLTLKFGPISYLSVWIAEASILDACLIGVSFPNLTQCILNVTSSSVACGPCGAPSICNVTDPECCEDYCQETTVVDTPIIEIYVNFTPTELQLQNLRHRVSNDTGIPYKDLAVVLVLLIKRANVAKIQIGLKDSTPSTTGIGGVEQSEKFNALVAYAASNELKRTLENTGIGGANVTALYLPVVVPEPDPGQNSPETSSSDASATPIGCGIFGLVVFISLWFKM